MAAKNLYDALINRAEIITVNDNGDDGVITTYKYQHTFIRIQKSYLGGRYVMVGFHLGSEEWELYTNIFPAKRNMPDILRSIIVSIVDNMTFDDDYYTFDQFVAAKCVLDWLLYV